MPFTFRPRHLSATCLGVLLGIAGPLQAGDIFPCLSHNKDRDRGLGTRAIGTPTVYMPQNAPAATQLMCTLAPAPRDTISTGLERALEAEHHAIMAEAARAAFKAEVEGKQRLLQKLGALDGGQTPSTELKAKLDKIENSLQTITTRLTDVERLLIVHDNILQDPTKVSPAAETSLQQINARLAEMDKLLTVHDNYLSQLSKNFGTPGAVPGPVIPSLPPPKQP
jgi:hypothetical protein